MREMSTEAEQQLLHNSRNGNTEEVRKLLGSLERKEVVANINCKGRSKSNLGWTPLHLACYFGHRQVVQDLLKAGAEVNVLNDMGDTPLHRAAFTGRKIHLFLAKAIIFKPGFCHFLRMQLTPKPGIKRCHSVSKSKLSKLNIR
uniref:Uncharacterized protein n=1 Tax=Monodelphis domestica TaxID=13616 RepID=A0A5F8H3Y5_MONDO